MEYRLDLLPGEQIIILRALRLEAERLEGRYSEDSRVRWEIDQVWQIYDRVCEVGVDQPDYGVLLGHHNPLEWPLGNQQILAMSIQLAKAEGYIGRIKACRTILSRCGYDGSLAVAKEFVEAAFSDEGRGSEIML